MIFTVVYSIHLENMMSTLLGRVDKVITFLQIFLGVAIVTSALPTASALAISILGIIQFVWQPGIKSAAAKASHDRWHDLYNKRENLSEKRLSEEIRLLSDRDEFVLSSLKLAAHISACRQLSLSIDMLPEMSFGQKLISTIAGAII